MKRRIKERSACRETGTAAVEFALVSLILFPMLFGMMGFALVLWAQQSVDHAAREGARLAAVGVKTAECNDWVTTVKNRGRGVEWIGNTPRFEILDTNEDAKANAGDEVLVTLEFAIVGAPGTLVEIATAVLPGDGEAVRLPDGSDGVALVREAKSRNEANAGDGMFASGCEAP